MEDALAILVWQEDDGNWSAWCDGMTSYENDPDLAFEVLRDQLDPNRMITRTDLVRDPTPILDYFK